MKVRLAEPSDLPDIIEMGRHNVETTKAGEPFEPEVLTAVFEEYLKTADPTFFVCEKDGKNIGLLIAGFADYEYRSGFFIVQRVLYVKPENRGSRASSSLTKHLIQWSRSVGAVEIKGGNDNDFQSERTAAFLEHFGFRKVGIAMSLDLGVRDG